MRDHGLGRDSSDFLQLWAEFHVSYFDSDAFLFTHVHHDFIIQQASLRVWDEERGQDLSSRRDTPNKPKKVILYSSHLTDAEHIAKYLQKDR